MSKSDAKTNIGLRRKLNQDMFFTSDAPVGNLKNLYIVADGMGGHNAGDLASRYTVEIMVEQIKSSQQQNPENILLEAIREANRFVRQKAYENPDLHGMGTTVVAATFVGKHMLVANVGDSRLYLVGDTIEQITVDHSLVEEMVQMGGIDRSVARNHPDKNIITRAIGAKDTVDPDFSIMAPVGLLGNGRISTFVLSVMAASSSSAVRRNSFSAFRSMITGVAPARSFLMTADVL